MYDIPALAFIIGFGALFLFGALGIWAYTKLTEKSNKKTNTSNTSVDAAPGFSQPSRCAMGCSGNP